MEKEPIINITLNFHLICRDVTVSTEDSVSVLGSLVKRGKDALRDKNKKKFWPFRKNKKREREDHRPHDG